jgi:hypothetical protein
LIRFQTYLLVRIFFLLEVTPAWGLASTPLGLSTVLVLVLVLNVYLDNLLLTIGVDGNCKKTQGNVLVKKTIKNHSVIPKREILVTLSVQILAYQ